MKDTYDLSDDRVYSRGKGKIIFGEGNPKYLTGIQLRNDLANGIDKYGLSGLSVEQRILLQKVMSKAVKDSQDIFSELISRDLFERVCLAEGLHPDSIRKYWGFDKSLETACLSRLAEIATGVYDNGSWNKFLTSMEKKAFDEKEADAKRILLAEDGKKVPVGHSKPPQQLELMF